jgi:hypothetical protein
MPDAVLNVLIIAAVIGAMWAAFQWGRMAERDDPTEPYIRDVELRLRKWNGRDEQIVFTPEGDWERRGIPVRHGPYDWRREDMGGVQ